MPLTKTQSTAARVAAPLIPTAPSALMSARYSDTGMRPMVPTSILKTVNVIRKDLTARYVPLRPVLATEKGKPSIVAMVPSLSAFLLAAQRRRRSTRAAA